MLELNELSPDLLQSFMAAGDLPNFKRLFEQSIIFRTDAAEAFPFLEPWIQWPTVHFGVSRQKHGAFHLGDGRKYRGPGIAKLLSDENVRVGVFGSMNMNYSNLNGYYLPDPWDESGTAYPSELSDFSTFVSKQVQESSRSDSKLKSSEAFRFLRFLVSNGLTLQTVAAVIKQLLNERIKPEVRWKRAMLLDNFGYDVFEALNKKFRVDFATFFSNSVAHFQHYHWRDMSPEIFVHEPEDLNPSHRTAIPEGYRRNDEIVGRAMRSYPDSTIIFATALSQQPWIDTAKCTYRPKDFSELLSFAGIHNARCAPLMAEEFRVIDADPEASRAALLALTRNGQSVMRAEIIEGGVQVGCSVFDGDVANLETIVEGPNGTARFGDLFYRLPAMRSGRHHPQGALWIRDGSPHRIVNESVALEVIAPTILSRFGINSPEGFASPISSRPERHVATVVNS